WSVIDSQMLANIENDLFPRQALLADGHHRYAAYRRYQFQHPFSARSHLRTDENRTYREVDNGWGQKAELTYQVKAPPAAALPSGGAAPLLSRAGPWDRGLAFLTASSSFGSEAQISAFHRVIAGLPISGAVLSAAPGFRVTRMTEGERGAQAALAA